MDGRPSRRRPTPRSGESSRRSEIGPSPSAETSPAASSSPAIRIGSIAIARRRRLISRPVAVGPGMADGNRREGGRRGPASSDLATTPACHASIPSGTARTVARPIPPIPPRATPASARSRTQSIRANASSRSRNRTSSARSARPGGGAGSSGRTTASASSSVPRCPGPRSGSRSDASWRWTRRTSSRPWSTCTASTSRSMRRRSVRPRSAST